MIELVVDAKEGLVKVFKGLFKGAERGATGNDGAVWRYLKFLYGAGEGGVYV